MSTNKLRPMPKLKPGLNSVQKIVAMSSSQTKLALMVCILLCVAIWLFTIDRIDSQRDQAIAGQLAGNSVLAQTQEGRFSNALQILDQVLLIVRDDFVTHGKPRSLNHRLEAVQVDRTYVGIVSLIDAKGDVIATTADDFKANFADREYFKDHAMDDTDRLLVGKPIIGRKSGKSIVSLTRRLYNADRSFAGVVFLALDPVFLAPNYSNVELAKDVTITLVGLDGIV